MRVEGWATLGDAATPGTPPWRVLRVAKEKNVHGQRNPLQPQGSNGTAPRRPGSRLLAEARDSIHNPRSGVPAALHGNGAVATGTISRVRLPIPSRFAVVVSPSAARMQVTLQRKALGPGKAVRRPTKPCRVARRARKLERVPRQRGPRG